MTETSAPVIEVQAKCSCDGRECGGWQLLDRIGRAWPSGPLLSECCAGQHDVYGPAVEGWQPFTTEPELAGYARGPGERPLVSGEPRSSVRWDPWPYVVRDEEREPRVGWRIAAAREELARSEEDARRVRADMEASIRKLGGWTG